MIRGTPGSSRAHRTPARWLLVGLLVLASCATQTSGTARGVVVEVVGDLTTIESFTILVDGERQTFGITGDGDYAFPPGHLRDHQRSGDPVLVGWEQQGDTRVAVSIDDG